MFSGITNISVDAKGRVAVPKLYRDHLDEIGIRDLTITIDPDRCLLLYPRDSWNSLAQKIMSLPNTTPHNRGLQRTYVGHATPVELDGNARILIPPALREFAEIGRKAVMLGQGQKIEVWGEEVWKERFSTYPDLLSGTSLESLSEEVKNLSI